MTFEYIPRPTIPDPEWAAFWEGFAEGSLCWQDCMLDLNKQALAAAGGAIGAGLPFPTFDKIYPKKVGFRISGTGPTSLGRVLDHAGHRFLGLDFSHLGRDVKRFPLRAIGKGGTVGLIWAEAALGFYCASKCNECPTNGRY